VFTVVNAIVTTKPVSIVYWLGFQSGRVYLTLEALKHSLEADMNGGDMNFPWHSRSRQSEGLLMVEGVSNE